MYLKSASTLALAMIASLHTAHNRAYKYGGGIYNEDVAEIVQCEFGATINDHHVDITDLPGCFIELEKLKYGSHGYVFGNKIKSHNDSAGISGDFLFGGLSDRCQLEANITGSSLRSILPYEFFQQRLISIQGGVNQLTSLPYQLCFCDNDQDEECQKVKRVIVHRGQSIRVALRALDQFKSNVVTTVTAKTSQTSSLQLNQNLQMLPNICYNLTYNFYSTQDTDRITLYSDGPCRDTGQSTAVLEATILPCPDAFIQSKERCICEQRLQNYNADCIINDTVYIHKRAGSRFWMNATYDNGSYNGLILYKTCPFIYCKDTYVNITLENPDVQCDANRRGLLCGACIANYSLMLGSFRCESCPNCIWLCCLYLF